MPMEYQQLITLSLPLFLPLLIYLILHGLGFSLHSKAHRLRLPPSPPKLPIIGHLHLLFSDMPHLALANLSARLGPLIHLKLGQIPTLVVSSPRLARDVLKTHDHAFASRPQLIAAQYLSFGCSDVTFSPYGAYWRQARKICVTELLSPRRVGSFTLIRQQEVARLLHSLPAATEVDMSERFFALANDILCRVAFGRRFAEAAQGLNLNEVLAETQALLAGFSVGDFFPGLEWVNRVSGLKGRLERNLRDLRTVCDEIIKEHVSSNGDDNGDAGMREDFLDVLLRVQKSSNLEVPITDDNLKALVLDMFVAGTDTTSATLEWVMTELARHPESMKKVQEEVRHVAGRHGRVEEDALPHLHYMKAAIKETLRLHPPVPLLVPRESMEKCTLDGYEIPAKTRVLINTYAIGRDPQNWDEPLQFRPERFIGSDIDMKGQDFELLPFGGGRRGCPGYTFGLASVEIALARLLYHFDWMLPEGVKADDIDLGEIFGLATRKRKPLVLVPISNGEYKLKDINNQLKE